MLKKALLLSVVLVGGMSAIGSKSPKKDKDKETVVVATPEATPAATAAEVKTVEVKTVETTKTEVKAEEVKTEAAKTEVKEEAKPGFFARQKTKASNFAAKHPNYVFAAKVTGAAAVVAAAVELGRQLGKQEAQQAEEAQA